MKKTKELRIGESRVELMESGAYHVRLHGGYDANGKRVTKSITTKDLSELKRIAFEWLSDPDRCGSQTQETITLGCAIDRYIDTCETAGRSPSTIAGYKKLRRIGYPRLIDKCIQKITPDDIQMQINASAKVHSPKTVSNEYGLLHKVLATYAPKLELKGIILPTKDNMLDEDDVVIQSDEEIRLLLETAKRDDQDLYLAIMFGCILGMRRSEICALEWNDVDLKNRTIRISKAVVRGHDNKYSVKAPKSKKGRRVLPIPSDMVPILESVTRKGTNVVNATPDAITRRYERLREVLGTHGRFHDLRHYHCSVMVALNVPEPYIMADMGHSTNNLYKRVYTHIRGDKEMQIYADLDKQASGLIAAKTPVQTA